MKLKSKEEYGTPTIEFGKNDAHFISLLNDWEQLFGKWNWYNLTLVEISLERDRIIPGYEFVFCILGIGFRLRINQPMDSTPEGRDTEARFKEAESEMNAEIKKQQLENYNKMENDGTL